MMIEHGKAVPLMKQAFAIETPGDVSLPYKRGERPIHISGDKIMPKGPRGEKRPADLIGMSVMVAKIAIGEIEDNVKAGRVKSGKAGGKARAESLTPEERSEIARSAANARWE